VTLQRWPKLRSFVPWSCVCVPNGPESSLQAACFAVRQGRILREAQAAQQDRLVVIRASRAAAAKLPAVPRPEQHVHQADAASLPSTRRGSSPKLGRLHM